MPKKQHITKTATLMHKTTPVVELELLDNGITIFSISKIHDQRHIPIGVKIRDNIDKKLLQEWLFGRSIPASRANLRDALEKLGKLDTLNATFLIEKCYALSLSDQYWLKPKDLDLKWEDINFFTNNFTEDVGKLLFGEYTGDYEKINLYSPDNTSDGWLPKKWNISNGECFLIKGGSGVFEQEPFNEVVASLLMKKLDIDHTPYTLMQENDKFYSSCKNFVTEDTELIPAWHIKQVLKKYNQENELQHFIRCCEELGIKDTQLDIDKMLAVDFIIANEDRHYGNFGYIRNSITLEWIGFAPIYDNGTSLWYNTQAIGSKIKSKPFRQDHNEQIKLVSNISWLKQVDITNESIKIFSKSNLIDNKRAEKIVEQIQLRLHKLLKN